MSKMILIDEATVQQALDALTFDGFTPKDLTHREYTTKAVAALRETLAVPQQEPFGYFRALPFGWTDCAETDEGAMALYEGSTQPAKGAA